MALPFLPLEHIPTLGEEGEMRLNAYLHELHLEAMDIESSIPTEELECAILTGMDKESENIPLHARVSEGKNERLHRKKFRELNGQLFWKWEEYSIGRISTN